MKSIVTLTAEQRNKITSSLKKKEGFEITVDVSENLICTIEVHKSDFFVEKALNVKMSVGQKVYMPTRFASSFSVPTTVENCEKILFGDHLFVLEDGRRVEITIK